MAAKKWTNRRLQKVFREWQETLRLMDWNLTVAFVPSYDDLPKDCHAYCYDHVEAKTAEIKLIHPDAYEDGLRPYIVEDKIVHELLHLHIDPLATKNSLAEEQAIEVLSDVLIKLKRRSRTVE